MKSVLLFLFFFPLWGSAQITDEKIIKACNRLFGAFIPKGYTVMDTAVSDFNKDGKKDVAIILQKIETLEANRAILILQKTGKGYQKNVYNPSIMYCKDCGGIYGDPYAQISFKGNILSLTNYGGSSWRWDFSYSFRYRNQNWELIRISHASYHNTGCADSCDVTSCSLQSKELDYITKKVHYIETDDGSCIPKKEFWKLVNTGTNISLKNFNCDTDYFKKIK